MSLRYQQFQSRLVKFCVNSGQTSDRTRPGWRIVTQPAASVKKKPTLSALIRCGSCGNSRQRLSWVYADLYPLQVVVCHMRVATYSQATAPTRGSLAALGILILTILLGTGVLPTLVDHFAGSYEREVTYVWLLVYGLSFLGLMVSQGINWVSWLVRYRLLLVVLMLGTIVSVSWSVDAKVSAERTIHLVGSTICLLYTSPSPRD